MSVSPPDGSVPGAPVDSGPVVPSQLQPLVPSPAPTAVAGRSQSRMPRVLAIVIGVVALVCVGGLGVAYHLYDRATAPNRSTPDAAVDGYLRGELVDQKSKEASQYVCANATGLDNFVAFRNAILKQVTQVEGSVSFGWGALPVTITGNTATVQAEVIVDTTTGAGITGESRHAWSFMVVRSNAWLVCGATSNG